MEPSGSSSPGVVDELAHLAGEVAGLRRAVEAVDPLERLGGPLRQLADQFEQARRQESRSLYLDLILLLDRVEAGLRAWADTPPVREFVATVRDEIDEILARRGVVPLVFTEPGFDPHRQRAVRVHPTERPAEDRHVVEVVRAGYECDGLLLRPQDVVVSRYSAADAGR